jgi:hypothetical protein
VYLSDRLGVRPSSSQFPHALWNSRVTVNSLLRSAMLFVYCLMLPHSVLYPPLFMDLIKMFCHRFGLRGVIVLKCYTVISVTRDYLRSDLLLAPHRIGCDDCPFEFKILEQHGNGRNFIRFLIDRLVTQN